MARPIESSEWVVEARKSYRIAIPNPPQETHLYHEAITRKFIGDWLLPSVTDKETLRTLLVGPGIDTGIIQCPYEPYTMAAHLEARKRDYAMSIVDIDPHVIEDIKKRQNIYRMLELYKGMGMHREQASGEAAW